MCNVCLILYIHMLKIKKIKDKLQSEKPEFEKKRIVSQSHDNIKKTKNGNLV